MHGTWYTWHHIPLPSLDEGRKVQATYTIVWLCIVLFLRVCQRVCQPIKWQCGAAMLICWYESVELEPWNHDYSCSCILRTVQGVYGAVSIFRSAKGCRNMYGTTVLYLLPRQYDSGLFKLNYSIFVCEYSIWVSEYVRAMYEYSTLYCISWS